eukprot:TRINITY_DN62289_c0_g1_i1.p1 TRINITY_DN62289_c0_g1~~TRINITY_DN62289_c0_g1_i1.p1  ORF type:complete len:957 (-),score=132.64 TRINITY_DN62289_c0_g1_i1:27-2897(-)
MTSEGSEVFAMLHKLDERLGHLEFMLTSIAVNSKFRQDPAYKAEGRRQAQVRIVFRDSADGRLAPGSEDQEVVNVTPTTSDESTQSKSGQSVTLVAGSSSDDGRASVDSSVDGDAVEHAMSGMSDEVKYVRGIAVRRARSVNTAALFQRKQSRLSKNETGTSGAESGDGSDASVWGKKKWSMPCSLHPGSWLRALLDALGLILVIHDMVAIPWMLAWDADLQSGVRHSLTASTCFWSLDICANFLTGFYDDEDGRVERRLRHIATHYVKGRFMLDFSMLCIDISTLGPTLATVSEQQEVAAWKFTKLLTLLRATRLARPLQDLMDSAGGFREVLGLVHLLCLVLWFSHIATCMWFVLGLQSDGTDTDFVWFDSVKHLPDGQSFVDTGLWYQYSATFNWALSQVTANSAGEILSPLNSLEHLFSIAFLIFGLFFSSHIVSKFSSSITRLELANQEKTELLRQLDQFLSQYQVDRALSNRVVRQVKERLNSRSRITEEEVPALKLLTFQLSRELRYAVRGDQIKSHSLMCVLGNISDTVLPEICDQAMKLIAIPAGDVVFHLGDAADRTYIVDHGQVTYESGDDVVQVVDSGAWLSEAALWTLWRHVGEAMAVRQCQLFALEAEPMLDIVEKYANIGRLVVAYGAVYHSHVQAATPPDAPAPDDLQVALTEYSDIVAKLSLEEQQLIGCIALQGLQKRGWAGPRLPAEKLEKLHDEMKTGKSVVIQEASGSVMRIAHIASLQLRDSNKRIFAQIGKISSSGHLIVEVLLPGGKQQSSELPTETLNRVLFQDALQPLSHHICIEGSYQEVFWKDSQQYGIRTKFTRTVHHGTLRLPDSCDLKVVTSPLAARPSSHTYSDIGRGVSRHGLDGDAYALGSYLYMFLEPQDFDFLSSGKGKDVVDWYASRVSLEAWESRASKASEASISARTPSTGHHHTPVHPAWPADDEMLDVACSNTPQ